MSKMFCAASLSDKKSLPIDDSDTLLARLKLHNFSSKAILIADKHSHKNHLSAFMKFCSECAHPVSLQIPPDDNRPRFVCDHCGVIHYQNPKLVVGSIPVWHHEGEHKILLCRRAIEPRHGFWTLPAGFMENGETTTDAAQRETEEEAGANIKLGALFAMINVPHVHQVHLFYLAELLDLDYAAGIESLEVAMFSEHEIPWSELAFPTVEYSLRSFFSDLAAIRQGAEGFRLHTDDMRKRMIETAPQNIQQAI